ncbi:MAG: hypothetical protein ACPG7F_00625 [Aggregatilineales bacterium]
MMHKPLRYGSLARIGHDIDMLIDYAERRNQYELRDRLKWLRTLTPDDVDDDTAQQLNALRLDVKYLLRDMERRMNESIWQTIRRMEHRP